MSHKTLKKSPPASCALEDEINALQEIFHDLVKTYRHTRDLKTRLDIANCLIAAYPDPNIQPPCPR